MHNPINFLGRFFLQLAEATPEAHSWDLGSNCRHDHASVRHWAVLAGAYQKMPNA
jgi:hypothetical protein